MIQKDNDNWILTVINNFEIFRFLGIISIVLLETGGN